MKSPRVTRRTIYAGGLLLAGCKTAASAYFGKTEPPSEQRLIYIVGGEPAALDPTTGSWGWDAYIVPAMFEGLTNYHPAGGPPLAALATHYEVNGDHTKFTFYLRGHDRPRGMKLANTDTLPEDFSRGRRAPDDRIPARWSDGRIITAEDFVYSWRRTVAGNPVGSYYLVHVRNAREISAGKAEPRSLGIRSLNDFTLEVDLRAHAPFFLELTSHRFFAAVPRHVIEPARAAGNEADWTKPGRIVTNGAFTLQEHKPNDRIVLVKNPAYYESGLVSLSSITFLPVIDGNTSANLYKVGDAHSMEGFRLPPLLATAIQTKKDVVSGPAFFHIHPEFNTKRPPFDNVLLRYALNMAADKDQIARLFGAARSAARSWVPPVRGYEGPKNLMITAGAKTYNVLAHDPAGARELLAEAGFPNGIDSRGRRLTLEYLFPPLPHSLPIAEILQQQWRRNLNITIKLVRLDFQTWNDRIAMRNFDLIESGGGGDYLDPSFYLNLFETGGVASGTWSDQRYDAMLRQANATPDPALRMRRLAECEALLLRAMPVMPMLYYGFNYLQKPYVHGLASNPLDNHPFKYAWIDTKWRPL